MAKFVAPSAATNDTLRAAVLALKLMPRTMRNELNKESRAMGNALWRPIVDSHASTPMDRLVLAKGARVKPGNPMVLVAGTSKRALRKGNGALIPNEYAPVFEFGSGNRPNKRQYERENRTNPGTHTVSRRTARQMPERRKNGRVVYQAAAEIAPRITAFWVQSIVRKIHKAHEG